MGSVFDYDKREVVGAVREQRARTIALLEDLGEPQWEAEVTPGWRAREVAAHLVSTDEAALTGRMLIELGARPRADGGVAAIEAWNDEQVRRWADRPVPVLLQGLERWGRRLARGLALTPAAVARRPIPTPFARVSLLWLVMMRVYDEWVHGEDVRRAFALPADDAPEAVRPAARHLLAAVPIQTLPRISAGGAGRVELRFTDLDLPGLVVDLGSRLFGLGLPDAAARVSGPAAALVMVAARRDPWRSAEDRGLLEVDGDRKAAETFLDALLAV